MNELFSIHAGYGWTALILLLAVMASRPLKDQPSDPQCWCEAFGVKREDCYCVGFGERAE